MECFKRPPILFIFSLSHLSSIFIPFRKNTMLPNPNQSILINFLHRGLNILISLAGDGDLFNGVNSLVRYPNREQTDCVLPLHS